MEDQNQGQEPAPQETPSDNNVDAAPEQGQAPQQEPAQQPLPDSIQNRFNQLVKQKGDAVRRADAAELNLEHLRLKFAGDPEDVQAANKPLTLEEYDYDEEALAKARLTAAIDEGFRVRMDQFNQAASASARQVRAGEFAGHEATYEAANPTYTQAVKALGPLNESQLGAFHALGADGPRVAHYIALNPDKAGFLSSDDPQLIDMELGRLAGATALNANQTKTPSTTPNPPTTLTGSGSSPPNVENMSMAEIYALK